MINLSHFKRLLAHSVILVVTAVCLFSASDARSQTGFLTFKAGTRNLGMVYKLTGPVGYFDVVDSIADVRIDTVYLGTNDPTFHIVDTLHFWYDPHPVIVQPGKFLRIAVFMDIRDELLHKTSVTVVYNGGRDSISDSLSVQGVGVTIHTTMEDRSAHAFETFSLPIIVDSCRDTLGNSYIQRYTNVLTYDPALLKLDTAALTIGIDSQGVSRNFTFKVDSPFTAGHVIIHASGPTNGIHAKGDTIYKLTFQAQQFLFTSKTTIQTDFTPDSGFLYASFSSQLSNFTTLQCSSPAKVVQAAAAQFLGNHPNPFNPSTRIRYSMDATGLVELAVYDRIGRLVRTLINGMVAQGEHDVVFNADDLPSGMYVCRLTTVAGVDQRMITLTR